MNERSKQAKVQPMNQRIRMVQVVSTYTSDRTSKLELFKGDEVFGPIPDHSLRWERNYLPKWANSSFLYSHSVDMSDLSRSDPGPYLAQWANHSFIHIEPLRSTTPVIIVSTPSHQHTSSATMEVNPTKLVYQSPNLAERFKFHDPIHLN
jgi:hypothetical protein